MSTAAKSSSQNKLSKEQVDALRRDIVNGISISEASAKYGISPVGVTYHRKVVRGDKRKNGRWLKPTDGQRTLSEVAMFPPAEDADDDADEHQGTRRLDERVTDLMEQIDADILAGMPDSELIRKYGISKHQIAYRRQKKAQAEPVQITPEQIPRLVEMVGRIAQRRPEVFAEMMQYVVKRNPYVFLEVM